jgi:hypothetical protein
MWVGIVSLVSRGDMTTIGTAAGDDVVVTLSWRGEEPAIMISVVDGEETPIPTAELTLREAAELREQIRRLCERAVVRGR